jgi:adenylosuccinate synthase
MDILDSFENIEVCVAYVVKGRKVTTFPATISELKHAKPVLKRMPGWRRATTACRSLHDLPPAARSYLAFIGGFTGVNVAMVSVGADRSATIVVDPKLKSWKF